MKKMEIIAVMIEKALYCTWMQVAASLILTNCFLSSRALNCRCRMTIRLRTSLWSKACSRWRSASRKNTWGEGPQWSQHWATHTLNEEGGMCGRAQWYTHTHTHILWNPWPDILSQVCQVWSSNYIDSILKARSPPSCLIHTLDLPNMGHCLHYILLFRGRMFSGNMRLSPTRSFPHVYDSIYSFSKSTV